jgi:PAS domain S-box-containing protein
MNIPKRMVALQVAIAAAGLGISVLAYVLAIRADDARIGQFLKFRAEWRVSDMSWKLTAPVNSLAAIAAMFGRIDDADLYSLDRAEIGRFRPLELLRVYLWAPRVAADERETFERRMREAGHREFSILQPDVAGRMTAALARAEYFPNARIWSFDGSPPPIGLDLSYNPASAAAMSKARDDGETVLVEPFQSAVTRTITLLYVAPVYRGGVVPGTVEERRAKLRGFAVGAALATYLFDRLLQDTPTSLAYLYVGLPSGAGGGAAAFAPFLRYAPAAGRFEVYDARLDPAALPGRAIPSPLQVAGRTWQAVFHFPPGVVASYRTPYLWGWIAGGLLVTGLILVAVNIEMAQTRRAERLVARRTADIQALRRRNEQILASAGEGIYGLDLEGRVTFINPAGARTLGYAADELSGQPMHAKCHHSHADGSPFPQSDCPIYAALRDGLAHAKGDDTMWRKDGSAVSVEYVSTPMRDEQGRIEGAVVVFRDITEQKADRARLAQAQKMDAVGQLTGGMAHDFNNLLGVVIGNLDLAAERLKDDQKTRGLVDAALSGALSGADLIKKLLAFSRRQTLAPETVDLNGRIEDLLGMLKRTLSENITIKTALAPGLPPVLVDPTQFDTAILNLAVNARDAMPGGGELRIETASRHLDADYAATHAEVAAGDYAMVAISDTGAGMPAEALARAFEPFFTTKETGKGTGLGLAMVHGFVKQSGGHASIYSEVGHGTTVRLYFPASKEADAAAPKGPAAEPAHAAGGETVLVVEDREDLRAAAVAMLRRLGYRTIEAGTGAAALAILEGGAKVDLVFTDIVMPGGMSGLDLVHEIRASGLKVPVVVTSGYASPHVLREQAQKLGLPTLAKPYRIAELAQKLRAALAARTGGGA